MFSITLFYCNKDWNKSLLNQKDSVQRLTKLTTPIVLLSLSVFIITVESQGSVEGEISPDWISIIGIISAIRDYMDKM